MEGDPTFAATAYREDQGCQARLLDMVVIAEGFEKGGEGKQKYISRSLCNAVWELCLHDGQGVRTAKSSRFP